MKQPFNKNNIWVRLTCMLIVTIVILFIAIANNVNMETETIEVEVEKITKQKDNTIVVIKEVVLDRQYMDEVDYSSMTKSQINTRISNLNKLYDTIADMNNMDILKEQLSSEIDNAKAVLNAGTYLYPYTQEDYDLLCFITHIEAGSDYLRFAEKLDVASVVVNRRNQGGISKNKPGITIGGVINEKGQYYVAQYWYIYWADGVVYKQNYKDGHTEAFDMSIVNDSVKEAVRQVLEHEYVTPANVVWQASFPQGPVYHYYENPSPGFSNTYICMSRG